MALHSQGRTAEADQLYRQLYAQYPQAIDLIHLIGLTTFELGRTDEGLAQLQASLRHRPTVAHYHANLGVKFIEVRRLTEAAAALAEAVALDPAAASHHYNLGNALLQQAHGSEAVACYRQCLALQPNHDKAQLQLGMALHSAGQPEEGIAFYRGVLAERPTDYAIATNLGALLQAQCNIDGAIEVFRQALAHEPQNFLALNNIAIMLKEKGEISESVQTLRQCIALSEQSPELHSNLILTLHYDPATTAADLTEQHQAWNRLLAPSALTTLGHPNSPEPHRRIRLGYVSADFRNHVVGYALLPAFRHHDHTRFEVFCYANNPDEELTAEFRRHADHWRSLAGSTDAQFAEQVRADQIDILIDLSLHTSDNRLRVFAQKPAPILASWLGYPESSGLAAMDYRLTDRYLEPPTGNLLAASDERACLLPDCWTCFAPAKGAPEVNPLPALNGLPFTFGCFNNYCKINDAVLAAWSRLLLVTPDSRLKLLTKPGSHRKRTLDFMVNEGVGAERILFADYIASAPSLSQGQLLARYHEVDLALDTFPYNGMSTTLDALWMGVPVVSLVGERNLGRAGLSLLSTIGLADFAVTSVEAYVDLASRLARDPARLVALRASLRERMRASPLLDAAGFTRKFETALSGMWLEWCQRQPKVG